MILIIADDPECLRNIEETLAPRQRVLVRKGSLAVGAAKRLGKRLHLVMVDIDLPSVVEDLLKECPKLPMVVFNGTVQRHTLEIAKSFAALLAKTAPV